MKHWLRTDQRIGFVRFAQHTHADVVPPDGDFAAWLAGIKIEMVHRARPFNERVDPFGGPGRRRRRPTLATGYCYVGHRSCRAIAPFLPL
jgi:hypothetical protein